MPPLTCPKCGTLITADTTPQQKAGKARWKHTTAKARRQAMSDLAKARWQKRGNAEVARTEGEKRS